MPRTFEFNELERAPLVVDAVYRGGPAKNAGASALARILPVGNSGGFRPRVGTGSKNLKYLVLYTDFSSPDWPDLLDETTGEFHYYGDNKTPGRDLHDTPKGGNRMLRDMFNDLHEGQRQNIPPIFVFSKGESGWDVVFRGLAVPGAPSVHRNEDLVAVWKSKNGERFQNYRAIFTILDVSQISRAWIADLENGHPVTENAPIAFLHWIESGRISALAAEPTVEYRTPAQQIPTDPADLELVKDLYEYFRPSPHKFEHCSAEITRLMDRNVVSYEVTRPWMDGGRDVLGRYRIGGVASNIEVDFAIESKCYDIQHGLGVRATSRLISRLRHRQFGVFMTTSFVQTQAYREIVEDRHPVIVIAAKDIVDVLRKSDLNTRDKLGNWLRATFS